MFRSFFFAGFEGTTGYNRHGQWIDQIAATKHDAQADDDYRRLREAGLLAAREVVRWPLVDQNGRYDFTSVRPFIAASRRHGIDVVWDLFHYGYPPDLDPFADVFVERFASYCDAVARHFGRELAGPHFFTPVNEPSFLAWAGGEVARFAPHQRGRGPELKVALVRAAIAGIDAIRRVLPRARFINVDPVCHVVAPAGRRHHNMDTHDFNHRAVFEAWDMLAGRTRPELGGSRRHLDLIGVNYYWTNQWEIGREECPLAPDDPRRVPLSSLLRSIFRRYGGEILVTETSHVDDMRPIWLRFVADECRKLVLEGLPLRGVCLYPILGMPEWHEPEVWARMGLWDLVPGEDAERTGLRRVEFSPLREELARAQSLLREALQASPARPVEDEPEQTDWKHRAARLDRRR